MARGYRHIQEYENEIQELKAQGATHREIAEHFGFTRAQVKEFFHRLHKKERKIAVGKLSLQIAEARQMGCLRGT